jgi:two-component system sensor histidine kinase PilS (NtrC family)
MELFLLSSGGRQEALEAQGNQTWKPLYILALVRLGLASLFATLATGGWLLRPLGDQNPALFLATSVAYLAFAVVALLANRWRYPSFRAQAYLNVVGDLAMVTLLMHASGGVDSGLGMLLVVPIAASSILLGGRAAVFLAAVATVTVLAETIYAHYERMFTVSNYPQAGLLGVTFFTTAILAHVLARRIRDSEALAQQRGVDLANLAQLAEHTIQRMQTGIVVVDASRRVRMINESAWYMLGMPSTATAPALERINHELALALNAWRINPESPSRFIRPSPNTAEILPRFARIGTRDNSGTLIFLEDTAALAQQAQQLKLASLAQLTASIAHEVRNPLGAIGHAAQLLGESPDLAANDRRLTEIIHEHSHRLNNIIENVMQLSRRDRSNPEVFQLLIFLQQFVSEFCASKDIDEGELELHVEPAELEVRFDRLQLQQILTNLCENGLHHGASNSDEPKLLLRAGIAMEFRRPYLDIIDRGPGIPEDVAERIFEPFFTTKSTGTGLGLYICRELAESNQAHISHIPVPSGGSCFRLSFQDARKQFV